MKQVFAALSILITVPATASAAELLVDFPAGRHPLFVGSGGFTVGWEFRADRALTVEALGFYDESGDGLVEMATVGLWNATGVELARAVVPAGRTSRLEGAFRLTDITPLQLSPGLYSIGYRQTLGRDIVTAPLTFTAQPGVTVTRALFTFGPDLARPQPIEANITFGATLYGSVAAAPPPPPPPPPVAPVPEPSSWALLIAGFGLSGALLRRQTRLGASAR